MSSKRAREESPSARKRDDRQPLKSISNKLKEKSKPRSKSSSKPAAASTAAGGSTATGAAKKAKKAALAWTPEEETFLVRSTYEYWYWHQAQINDACWRAVKKQFASAANKSDSNISSRTADECEKRWTSIADDFESLTYVMKRPGAVWDPDRKECRAPPDVVQQLHEESRAWVNRPWYPHIDYKMVKEMWHVTQQWSF